MRRPHQRIQTCSLTSHDTVSGTHRVVERIGDRARTVVMDMVGFGLSEKPMEGTCQENFTLQLQADLYDELAKKLGLKTMILIAHDMGQLDMLDTPGVGGSNRADETELRDVTHVRSLGKWRPALGSTAQKTFAVPRRSYSLSRRDSRPGSAGVGARTSACSVTGFSSKQIIGCVGS